MHTITRKRFCFCRGAAQMRNVHTSTQNISVFSNILFLLLHILEFTCYCCHWYPSMVNRKKPSIYIRIRSFKLKRTKTMMTTVTTTTKTAAWTTKVSHRCLGERENIFLFTRNSNNVKQIMFDLNQSSSMSYCVPPKRMVLRTLLFFSEESSSSHNHVRNTSNQRTQQKHLTI